jgi:2',3'-cyclic-nucleotide 2'-phosphodiesterase (5'-nucleotidase family)
LALRLGGGLSLAHLGEDRRIARETDVDVICGGHVKPARSRRIAGTLLVRPEVVGRLDAPIDLSDWNGAGETRIGNLVADAVRWGGDADIGVYHDGGLRGDRITVGELTAFDLASVVPFTDPIHVLDVSGERLRATLRQLDGRCLGLADERSWFGNVSGARVVRDADHGRLVDPTVDGDPTDDDARYALALPGYLSRSDHVVDAVGEQQVVRTSDETVYESLIAYVREAGVDPAVEGRMRVL